jgi:serine/threonine protein kinase
MHSIGIAHRDIKFENIMLNKDQPKFIDFGLSKILVVGETSNERNGTIAYSSPEILLGYNHDFSTDIWSLGIVLHALLSGEFPFADKDIEKTKRNIAF